MRQLRDFLCEKCGIEEERYVDSSIKSMPCSKGCGGQMIRLIGMPKVDLDGTNPDFPTAYDRWANIREQNRVVKGKRSYQRP